MGRAAPRETPQLPQRHFHVARAEFDRVVEIRELATVPDLHGASVPRPVLPDAHAFRVVAVGAERRGAGGADPLVPALVPLVLLLQALLERLHETLPAAQGLDFGLFGLRQVADADFLQPAGRQLALEELEQALRPLEVGGEGLVESVVEALVLDQAGARQMVEALGAAVAQLGLERLEQRQQFRDGHGNARASQQQKESNEHSAD